MCTQAKDKSFSIKCNTNTRGTNSAHTTVHEDSMYWYTINIYIPRFNYICLAVRVVKLYTHDVHSAPTAQEGVVQISAVKKKKKL